MPGDAIGPSVVTRRYVRAVAASPSYAPVGGTAHPELPAGYRTHDLAVSLGRGEAVFGRASAALTSWTMHADAGIEVLPAGEPVRAGATVQLRFGVGPLRSTAPCRVVSVVDDPRCAGFAYGTLPGHPERGEESFAVHLDDDGEVTFRIRAFSRPARRVPAPARLVMERIQDHILRRYLRAMIRRGAGG